MADYVLNGLLKGELHHSKILSSLSTTSPITFNDVVVEISEFIPHFMAFLRSRLLNYTDQQGASKPYFSPRQKEEQRKAERNRFKATNKGNISGRSARASLQYSSSSPMKSFNNNNDKKSSSFNHNNHSSVDIGISGISPIKNADTNNSRRNKLRNGRKAKVKAVPIANFELDSLDDFPSMSSGGGSNKNPRRITVTTVGTIRNNTSTNQLNKVDPSSLNTSFKETSSSFLEESTFEMQNADPSFENLFSGDTKRFNKSSDMPRIATSTNEISTKEIDLGSLSLSHGKVDLTPTKAKTEILCTDNVSEKEMIDVFSEIYSYICRKNLIPNVTLEVYFLLTILTTRVANSNQPASGDRFVHPFLSIECIVYFAVVCLESMKQIVAMLDSKSLMLLYENTRLQQFTTPQFLEYLENEVNADESVNLSLNNSCLIKSPNTGIAFQTESDNRKSFISDRHFYSFSKKRDAFYSILRQWEENLGDPDWSLTMFLSKKVNEFMKIQDGLNNDFQFARLFIGQLVEMHKNQIGDKTEEPETSDGVLIELKKRDPIRFQSLQNRLTGPSSTCDPCPKLSFSKVEEFFKEFIRISDSYMFNKALIHVLVLKIKSQNSNFFGLNQQINAQLNKSDFSETLWQEMKSAIGELRLYAKFLGFTLFLPYHAMSANTELVCSRELVGEPLNLKSFLKEAFMKHRLVITVPWVVDFLSLADKKAFKINCYKEALDYLLFLYRNLSLRLTEQSFFLSNLTLTLHIGWLFDQNPCDGINFYQSHCEKNNEDAYVSNGVDVIGLDDIVIVDKSFVFMLCPYLKVIKRPLVDFKKKVLINNSGTFRKITPVRSTDISHIDTQANLKNKLLEGFMKYIPNHVKDCMNYVTERQVKNLILYTKMRTNALILYG